MNLYTVWNVLGRLIGLYAAILVVPLAVSLWYAPMHPGMGEPVAFIVTIVIGAAVGLLLRWRFPSDFTKLGHREGFAVVAFGWMALTIIGCLPYMLLSGVSPATGASLRLGLVDAMFETMSGLTTTGATILTDIEAYGHGILFYRSLTQWLGGMGIILLTVAILPGLGAGGYQMIRWEGVGPSADKIAPRIAQTARILWSVYLVLTLVQIILLWAPSWFVDPAELEPPDLVAPFAVDGGEGAAPYIHYRSGAPYMDLYESICHALTTLPSGGYSTRNDSIGGYSAYIQYIVIIFMVLSGVNFVLQWQVLTGRPRVLLRNAEFRMYLTVIATAAVLITLVLLFVPIDPATGHGDDRAGAPRMIGQDPWPAVGEGGSSPEKYATLESTFRHSLFNAVSVLTTTGYDVADYDRWPDGARILLVALMLMGACAGSTSGSLKQIRILVVVKHAFVEVQRLVYPHRVVHVKVQGMRVSDRVVSAIIGAFTLFLLLLLLGTFLFALMPGFDLVTAFSSSVAMTCNIGPGLGAVGPAASFAWIPDVGKLLCIFLMLMGRLEVYTVLVLLLPAMYRK